jgi:hypothetical protein
VTASTSLRVALRISIVWVSAMVKDDGFLFLRPNVRVKSQRTYSLSGLDGQLNFPPLPYEALQKYEIHAHS